ncbi:MAG: riboflavin synthase [candidate division WOR-3 bacterium]
MFTGLIEEIGRLANTADTRGNLVLTIEAGFAPQLRPGDSVAVDGCCLTVIKANSYRFQVEAVAATLKQTTLSELHIGSRVNLERALVLGDRLGGHFVQGHVDELAVLTNVERVTGSWGMAFRVKAENRRFLVEHGSVCVNGVSLTIAGLKPEGFRVNVIPHTWNNTNLKELRVGNKVNLEYDLLVKAVWRTLGTRMGT